MPSPSDIRRIRTSPRVTRVIAIKERRAVAGYTFAKVRDAGKTGKLRKFVKRGELPKSYRRYLTAPEKKPMEHPELEERLARMTRKSAEKMDKAGLKLRFVANRNAGFVFDRDRMRFVRLKK